MSDGVRVCGVPDQLGQGANCRWPDGDIPWTIVELIPGIDFETLKATATKAFSAWAAVCGIKPRYTDNARSARILIGTRKIDGPSGVLAESELPCGNKAQCRQWYDGSERWGVFDSPTSGNLLDLLRVLKHEIGHALGASHNAPGTGGIMDPTYSQTIINPTKPDIVVMVGKYGQPVSVPTVPTTPPTTPTGGNPMQNFLMQMVMQFVKAWLEKAIADGTLTKILTDLLSKINTGQIVTAEQMVAELNGHAQALTQP